MEDNFDIRKQQLGGKDKDYENALRPLRFEDFSGQDKVVDNLRIFVKAARLYPLTHPIPSPRSLLKYLRKQKT